MYNSNTIFTTPLPDLEFCKQFDKNCSVLDAGCGYGRTLSYLQKHGFLNLTGFDISESYVRQAKSVIPSANIFVSDLANFKIDQKFDLILLMGVIEYLVSNNEFERLLKNISIHLSKDGKVLLETFIIDTRRNWKEYILGFLSTLEIGFFVNSKGYPCRHRSVESLRKLLSEHFIIESDQPCTFTTWSGNTCKGQRFILHNK